MTRFPGRSLAYLLFLFACLAPHGLRAAATADELVQQANEKYVAGDFAGALAIVERAAQLAPSEPRVYFLRALARSSLNDIAGARADFDRVISLDPKSGNAFLYRAVIKADQQDLAGALADADAAIELGEYDAFGVKVRIHERRREWKNMIEDVSRLFELRGPDMGSLFMRAAAYVQVLDNAKAAADFDHAVSLAPNNGLPHLRRASFRLYTLHDFPGALADARAAYAGGTQSGEVARVLGYSLLAGGEYGEAAAILGRHAELDPKNAPYSLLARDLLLGLEGSPDDRLVKALPGWTDPWTQALGQWALGRMPAEQLRALIPQAATPAEKAGRECEFDFYLGLVALRTNRAGAGRWFQATLGTNQTAFIEYALALALSKRIENGDDLLRQGNLKFRAKDFAGAIDAYNRLLEIQPKAAEAYVMRARSRFNLNDRSGAMADVALALSFNPKLASAFLLRGEIRMAGDEFPGALADLTTAVEFSPQTGRAWLARGRVQLFMKNWDAALSDLTHALDLNPRDLEARLDRASAYSGKGDYTSAENDLNVAIQLAPDLGAPYAQRAALRGYRRLDFSGAIADARLAVARAPKSAIAILACLLFAKGEFAEAARTFATLAEMRPADGHYALILRHLALLRSAGVDDQLAKASAGWTDPWTQALARFVCGQLTEEQLEASIGTAKTPAEKSGRQCEAHFYIGLARLLKGDRSTARLRFQSAVATQQTDFDEYMLAQAELARL